MCGMQLMAAYEAAQGDFLLCTAGIRPETHSGGNVRYKFILPENEKNLKTTSKQPAIAFYNARKHR